MKKEMFAALDWVPTFVDIAGGPKGDDLNKEIQAGKYPGIVKTMLDGVDQRAYPRRHVGALSARLLLLLFGRDASAVRWKNWKFVLRNVGKRGDWLVPASRSTTTGPRLTTSSVTPSSRPWALMPKDCRRPWRGAWFSVLRLFVRLELAAHRPIAVGEGTLFLQGVPAAASSGNLQPGRHPQANGEEQRRRLARKGQTTLAGT